MIRVFPIQEKSAADTIAFCQELDECEAMYASSIWDPSRNLSSSTLSEIQPANSQVSIPSPFKNAPPTLPVTAVQRRVDRSGFLTMAERVLPIAEATLIDDVKKFEDACAPFPLKYIVWAGMGGSAEIGKVIQRIQSVCCPSRKVFILDSSDCNALYAIIDSIIALQKQENGDTEEAETMKDALLRTVVIGVSLGMTSEEPVINMAAMETAYQSCSIPAEEIGKRFFGMTLENSTVHEFLKLKGFGHNRLPIQLDNRSTISGRNSYSSRVGLLHHALIGASSLPFLSAQSEPLFNKSECRYAAVQLAQSISAAEAQGYSQLTIILPPSIAAVASFWLMQQTEESLGKCSDHLLKLDVIQSAEELESLLSKGHSSSPLPKALRHRAFLSISWMNEPSMASACSFKTRIESLGLPWITVDINQDYLSLPCSFIDAEVKTSFLFHFWVTTILAIGRIWKRDTVGQYFVEQYKTNVQQFILEALAVGPTSRAVFDISEVNTSAVTAAKQAWLFRSNLKENSIFDTESYKSLYSSKHCASFEGVSMLFNGVLLSDDFAADDTPTHRYSLIQFKQALCTVLGMESAAMEASDGVHSFAADEIMAALLYLIKSDGDVTFSEVTNFGDFCHSSAGCDLEAAWKEMATQLLGTYAQTLCHVVEAPRDNHSRLEMSMGAKNQGLILLSTSSIHELRNRVSGSCSSSSSPSSSSAVSYPVEYLPLQCLATFQSYLQHQRRVILFDGPVTPAWIASFTASVSCHLKTVM